MTEILLKGRKTLTHPSISLSYTASIEIGPLGRTDPPKKLAESTLIQGHGKSEVYNKAKKKLC